MGIRVPASDENVMNAMAETGYHYEYSEPLRYTGVINKMSSENYRYFKDFFLMPDGRMRKLSNIQCHILSVLVH